RRHREDASEQRLPQARGPRSGRADAVRDQDRDRRHPREAAVAAACAERCCSAKMHCRLDAQHAGSADGGIPSIGTTTSPSPGGALLHLKVEWHQRCSTRRRTPDRSACRTSVGECGAPSMPEPDELTNSEEVAVKKIESAVETGSPRRINKL